MTTKVFKKNKDKQECREPEVGDVYQDIGHPGSSNPLYMIVEFGGLYGLIALNDGGSYSGDSFADIEEVFAGDKDDFEFIPEITITS